MILLGPGSYNPENPWDKKKLKSQKPEWQQVNFVRLPNAPSIPSHNQVFGYEELASKYIYLYI